MQGGSVVDPRAVFICRDANTCAVESSDHIVDEGAGPGPSASAGSLDAAAIEASIRSAASQSACPALNGILLSILSIIFSSRRMSMAGGRIAGVDLPPPPPLLQQQLHRRRGPPQTSVPTWPSAVRRRQSGLANGAICFSLSRVGRVKRGRQRRRERDREAVAKGCFKLWRGAST
jgi:hypothetical protein